MASLGTPSAAAAPDSVETIVYPGMSYQFIRPVSVAVDQVTGMVYLADDSDVTVIDGATNTLIASIATDDPSSLAVDEATDMIYVANYMGNDVSVIDGATNTLVATIPVGTEPTRILANPNTDTIYVDNSYYGTGTPASVSVIDGTTNTVTATLAASPGLEAINPATNTLYFLGGTSSSLRAMDAATFTVTASAPLTAPVYGPLLVDPTTDTLYLDGPFDSSSDGITVMDGTTLNETGDYRLDGTTCSQGDIDPSIHTIYLNCEPGQLTDFDTLTNAVSGSRVVSQYNSIGAMVDDPVSHVLYAGTSQPSVLVIDARQAPSPPTVTGASTSGGQVILSWSPPGGDGGSPVTGYTVSATPQGGGTTVSTTVSADQSTATVAGLTDNRAYSVTVVADNAIGTGEPSIAQLLTPPAPTVATNVALTSSPNPGQPGQPITYSATVTPTPPAGTLQIWDNGSYVCGGPASATLSCQSTYPFQGSHQIDANFSGQSGSVDYTPSSSSTLIETVKPLPVPPAAPPPCPSGVKHQAPGEPWAVAADIRNVDGRICAGYWIVTRSGGVISVGAAPWLGDASGYKLSSPIVDIKATPDSGGYWLVAADGGIYHYGDATFYGSLRGMRLNRPVVAMSPTGDGKGYWLVASDGGIFAFGDTQFYGSLGDIRLNKPIVGIAPGPRGKGYWMVASDGGIFAFGNAGFYGSLGSVRLAAPITGMTPEPGGAGYRLVGSDGGVFSFGSAQYYGSLPGLHVSNPNVTTMAPSVDGRGYYLINATGTVWSFGDAPFLGNA